MNDRLRCWFLLLLFALAPATEEIWGHDLSAALASGRPVVVLVGSPSCHWCETLKQDAVDDDGLRQALTQTAAVEIDGQADPAFCARFGIVAFPTLVLVNRRHEVVRILRGYQPAGDLAAALRVLVLRGDEAQPQAKRLDRPAPATELLRAADPIAAVATALDASSPDDRRRLGAELAALAPARDLLWTLLDHPRPGVRLDAATALAVALGHEGGFDPLASADERRAQIAAWKQEAVP